MENPDLTNMLMTRSEVAAVMRVTTRAVHKWARQGLVRPVRLPGRKRAIGYLRADILRLLETR